MNLQLLGEGDTQRERELHALFPQNLHYASLYLGVTCILYYILYNKPVNVIKHLFDFCEPFKQTIEPKKVIRTLIYSRVVGQSIGDNLGLLTDI